MNLKSRFSLFMMLLLVGSATLIAQTAPRIVDAHLHYNGDPAFAEKVVEKLEPMNGLALLLTQPKDIGSAKAAIAKHPNRLMGMGEFELDDPAAVQLVDRFHEAGFRGLGELELPLKNYDDRSYYPIYERAEKYGMILLIHTGIVNRTHPEIPTEISVDRMRVTTIDAIARRFPKVTIIGAHMGNPDYSWAAEIARWNPNVYFDVSGSSLQKKESDPTFWKTIFWWTGAGGPHTPAGGANAFERLVFGSDVFDGELEEFDREVGRYHKMLDANGVPKTAQENIFAGTLWRILNAQGH
jgi:hypothetical protein